MSYLVTFPHYLLVLILSQCTGNQQSDILAFGNNKINYIFTYCVVRLFSVTKEKLTTTRNNPSLLREQRFGHLQFIISSHVWSRHSQFANPCHCSYWYWAMLHIKILYSPLLITNISQLISNQRFLSPDKNCRRNPGKRHHKTGRRLNQLSIKLIGTLRCIYL